MAIYLFFIYFNRYINWEDFFSDKYEDKLPAIKIISIYFLNMFLF